MNLLEAAGPEAASQPDVLLQDSRWQLALRVVQGSEFQRSERLRNFLLFVCRKTICKEAEEICEQIVGVEVFGRRPDYNPSDDNIVRVEARELRKRLNRHFSKEGRAEPICIRIPKGSYVPQFEVNTQALEAQPAGFAGERQASAPPPSANPDMPPALATKSYIQGEITGVGPSASRITLGSVSRSIGKVPLSTILLGAVAIILLFVRLPGRKGAHANSATATTIWAELFPSSRPLAIVVSDSSLVLGEEISGKIVPLDEYYSNRFEQTLKGPGLPMILPRRYTDSADVLLTSELLQSGLTQGRSVALQYPRDLKPADVENNNLIFLGSSYSDPWIKEFDAGRQFVLGIDPHINQLCFFSKSPGSNESDRYCSGGSNGRTDETYGLLTYLPNLRGSGNVLVLEGTNSEGTEAAGDIVSDPRSAAQIRDDLGVASGKPLPYFQLLVRATELDSTPAKLQVIAHRILPFAKS